LPLEGFDLGDDRHDLDTAASERAGLANDVLALRPQLFEWASQLVTCFRSGGRLYVFGNGGSAADAQHLAAELVGRFEGERRALPAVALTTDLVSLTAIANDYGYDKVFARQVQALARPGDVVLGISTSGRSPSILRGLAAAADAGAVRWLLTSATAGLVDDTADSLLAIGATSTPVVQEGHRMVSHVLCDLVGSLLTQPVQSASTTTRVVDIDDAIVRREAWRRCGREVVTTNGCFDLLHEGHVAALAEARAQGDHLIVMLNTDASARRSKGDDRPVVPFEQRAAVLAALRAVDLVVALDDDTPVSLLDRLRPDVHCKGAQYEPDDLPEAEVVRHHQGRVHFTAMVDERSTSDLVARVTGR
jgi:rfaE bifunctional protein nucleotidyltransferase chain/domain